MILVENYTLAVILYPGNDLLGFWRTRRTWRASLAL
jgi:hypothetical protein